MKPAIIVSTQDKAGMNIKQNLLDLGFKETGEEYGGHKVYEHSNARLYTTDSDSIHCEDIDKRIAGAGPAGFDADIIIFATKHKAASGINSLSVHSPGNWGKAELGGKDRRLCIAPASYLKAALLKLDERIKGKENSGLKDYEIIQECTHHGPYIETPCFFIEIGSEERSWADKKAGKVIAEIIIWLIDNPPEQCKAVFGIGGLHHTPEISKITRRTGYAVGHVCPKYNLENLDAEMIRQAIERTMEKAELVVLDWKALGEHKERIKGVLDEVGIDWKKVKEMI